MTFKKMLAVTLCLGMIICSTLPILANNHKALNSKITLLARSAGGGGGGGGGGGSSSGGGGGSGSSSSGGSGGGGSSSGGRSSGGGGSSSGGRSSGGGGSSSSGSSSGGSISAGGRSVSGGGGGNGSDSGSNSSGSSSSGGSGGGGPLSKDYTRYDGDFPEDYPTINAGGDNLTPLRDDISATLYTADGNKITINRSGSGGGNGSSNSTNRGPSISGGAGGGNGSDTPITGWIKSSNDNKWYYYEGNQSANTSKKSTGWKEIGDSWYYFGENGALYQNTVTPDGYTVDANGAWIK